MSRRRRWQLYVAGFVLGILAVGISLNAGRSDAPPCSPGWHQAPAELGPWRPGPCIDRFPRGQAPRCVLVDHARPRPPLKFTLASCVPDARRGHG